MTTVKTIVNEGLHGHIIKDDDGFSVDVQCMGHGNKELSEILDSLGVITLLNRLNTGERIVFRDAILNRW